jgi:hypothetical protein
MLMIPRFAFIAFSAASIARSIKINHNNFKPLKRYVTSFRIRMGEIADDDNTPYLDPMGALPENSLHRDDYLFGEKHTFQSLGVNKDLCEALSIAGKSVATTIQAASFTTIISGKGFCLINIF